MSDDYIEQLIKEAGKRPEPSPESAEAIRQATHQAWKNAVKKNKRRVITRRLILGNVAAVVLFAVIGMIKFLPTDETASYQNVGSIIYADRSFDMNNSTQSRKDRVRIGDTLSTTDNALLTVQLNDQTQIIFAQNTSVQFTGIGSIYLRHGKIFVDSPGEDTSIVVETTVGSVQDIGTQFEVDTDGKALKVAMREGSVKIDLGETIEYAYFKDGNGDIMHIDAEKNIHKSQIRNNDDYWAWTDSAVKPLPLKGASVFDTLSWVGRVSGKEVVYKSPSAQTQAKETYFSSGELKANSIDAMLPALMTSTNLQLNMQENKIMISEM